jgi:lysyl-tRNA synthetase class 2
VFSGDKRAAVAYRCFNGVGLASGDPVGDGASFEDAARRFVEHCDRHGWRPAVLGARDGRVEVWERAGLRALYLGDEAIIDVGSFTLEGRKIRNVRQSLVHARRAGITTEVRREGDLEPALRRTLRDIAERARQGAPERGFSMALGGVLDGSEPSCIVVIARDADGTPVGFQRYVPCRLGDVWSLDVMRREPDSPNGVNELMIVDLIEHARTHGVVQVSLNFAAFRGLIDPEEELSFGQAAGAWFIKKLSPHFKMESLQRFNEKFRPRWVPRYLMYRSLSDFAAVGIASLNAEQFVQKARAEELLEPIARGT